MKTVWLVRVADRSHPLLVPLVWLTFSLGYLTLVKNLNTSALEVWPSEAALWGTILVYCLVPAYFFLCTPYIWHRSEAAVQVLTPILPDPALAQRRVAQPPLWVQALGIVLGVTHGLLQYQQLLFSPVPSDSVLLDYSMLAANVIVWATIFWLLAWRLYSASGLCRIGFSVRADIYDKRPLRPFVQVAMLDILVVMGALALMPLQSLDAEFRWENYEAGLIVGVVSSLFFFTLPQWGVHRNLVARKSERLEELREAINGCDHADVVRLHALVSHRHIIQSTSSWPVDLKMLTRSLFYLVIPPLAWVGAALVENFVNRFL